MSLKVMADGSNRYVSPAILFEKSIILTMSEVGLPISSSALIPRENSSPG
jgi:hypothetical protein